jgi:hypothetical protein
MSTNRSKERSSLCSFTFADGRHCRTLECGGLAAAFEAEALAIPTSARSTPASCSGGSSDRHRDGRERPCPSSRGHRSQIPTLSDRRVAKRYRDEFLVTGIEAQK